jgi:hypothetical protein
MSSEFLHLSLSTSAHQNSNPENKVQVLYQTSLVSEKLRQTTPLSLAGKTIYMNRSESRLNHAAREKSLSGKSFLADSKP